MLITIETDDRYLYDMCRLWAESKKVFLSDETHALWMECQIKKMEE